MRRTSVLVLVMLTVSLASLPASGEGTEGERLFKEGYALYAKGHFKDSIKALRRAAKKATKGKLMARIHGYLGVNFFVTNMRKKALEHFAVALRYDPAFKLDLKEVGEGIITMLDTTRQKYWGRLKIRVRNRRLAVYIDAKREGWTPWSGRRRIGVYRVQLETHDGHWGCEQEAVVRIKATTQITCEPERFTGRLSLVTTPPEAKVYLGTKLLGRTPLKEVQIPVGSHELRVKLMGYKEQKVKVEVRKDLPAALALNMTSLVKAPARGRLVVRSRPPGAQVRMDDRPLGKTPLSREVHAGEPRLTVELKGYRPISRLVRVPGGGTAEVELVLNREARGQAVVTVTPPMKAPTPPPGPKKRRRLWTWVAAGGAVVAAAVGLGLGLSVKSDVDEWESLTYLDTDRLDELVDSIPTKATVSTVMFATAGALAITAGVLFFVEGRSDRPSEPAGKAPPPRGGAFRLIPIVGQTSGLVITTQF